MHIYKEKPSVDSEMLPGAEIARENSRIFKEKLRPPTGKKNDDCFVVTATMGTADHPTVIFLRKFREDYLRESIAGRLSIKVYYIVGPVMAALIRKSDLLRKLSHIIIVTPLEKIARLMMRS